MKNFILTSALLLSCFAYSEQGPEPTNSVTSNNHQVYVGTDVFGYHQTKRNQHTKVTIHATLGGLRLGYDYLKPLSFYFGTEGVVAMGGDTIKYDTRDWRGQQSRKHTSIPLFANLEQRYGYTYQTALSLKTTLIPFIGVGGYYIRPEFKKGSTFSTWLYGAGGVRMSQQLCKNFDAGFNLKAMYILIGKTRVMWLSDTYRNVWGYEVAMSLTWHIGTEKKWNMQLQPYLLKFDVNTIGYIVGARLQAGFNF